jgi:tyrosine-protein kinase Etk/Wzc
MFDTRATPQTAGHGTERPTDQSDLTLGDLYSIVRRRWWVVLLIVGVILTGTIARMKRDVPVYSAKASMEKRPDENLLESGWLGYYALTPEAMSAQLSIIRSAAIVGPVVDTLGLRLTISRPELHRFALFSYIHVDSAARPATYEIAKTPAGYALRDPDGGRVYSTTGITNRLTGPGFMVDLVPGVTLEKPLAIAIVSRPEAVSKTSAELLVELERGSNLVHVTATTTDAALSAAVANAVANEYVWYSGREKRNKATEMQKFAAQQLKALDDSMALTSMMMHTRQQGPGAGSKTGDNNFGKLVLDTESKVQDLKFREKLLENVSTELKSGSDAAFESLLSLSEYVPGASDLYRDLDMLRADRAKALSGSIATPDLAAKDAAIQRKKADIVSAINGTLAVVRADRMKTEAQLSTYNQRYAESNVNAGDQDRLDQQLEGQKRLYASISDKLHEAMITAATTKSDVEIVEQANPPLSPVDTHNSRRVALALMVSLALGMMAALLLEQLDTRIRDAADATRHSGLNVIGLIPPLRADNALGRPLPLAMQEQAVGAEAFRKLRTSLRFVKAESPRVIAVTSPSPSEGKSVVSANLALALVQQRSTVVLIDADMRKPVQHSIFGTGRQPGLSDTLVGIVSGLEALREFPDMPGLRLMACGTEAPNPSELLSSVEFARLLKLLSERFDYVIVDTPPVQLVSDAAVVASIVDGTVVVCDNTKTERGSLASAVRELRQTNGSLLGVVINRAVAQRGYHGYKYYDSGYYSASSGNGSSSQRPRNWREHVRQSAGTARTFLTPFL